MILPKTIKTLKPKSKPKSAEESMVRSKIFCRLRVRVSRQPTVAEVSSVFHRSKVSQVFQFPLKSQEFTRDLNKNEQIKLIAN